jgi:hypothetical protein
MTNNLTQAEFWWLIGILEGEGFFGYQTTQRVCVSMTDEDTMLKVACIYTKITGKTYVLRNDAVSEERQSRGDKKCFRIEIYGDSARTIMLMVVPHMSQRRRQRIWQSLNAYKEPKKNLNVDNIVKLIMSRK